MGEPPTPLHIHNPGSQLLFQQHVPIKSNPPLIHAAPFKEYITGLTDSAGARLLPQLWRSALVCNTDLCTVSHRWLHLHTASSRGPVFTSKVGKTIFFPAFATPKVAGSPGAAQLHNEDTKFVFLGWNLKRRRTEAGAAVGVYCGRP